MNEKITPIAIIGGGSAGTMAALRTVLNNDETLFFPGTSKDKKRSRAFWVTKVENVPGHLQYKKGIEQPNRESLDFLANGPFKEKFHWFKNTGITKIEKLSSGEFKLTDSKENEHFAKYVILCTGVTDVQPHINGDISPVFPYANAQIIDYCLRCDGHHVLGKKTGVIGHTIGAAWVSIMLHERYQCPSMTILTNGEEPQFDKEVETLLKKYNISVFKDKIIEISGDPKGPVLNGFRLESGEIIPIEWCFVSLGMIVYNELAISLGAQIDSRGFVVTDEKGQSSVEGLYVAGDLRAGIKKQIYTAWDSAVDSADHINALLRRERRK